MKRDIKHFVLYVVGVLVLLGFVLPLNVLSACSPPYGCDEFYIWVLGLIVHCTSDGTVSVNFALINILSFAYYRSLLHYIFIIGIPLFIVAVFLEAGGKRKYNKISKSSFVLMILSSIMLVIGSSYVFAMMNEYGIGVIPIIIGVTLGLMTSIIIYTDR